ncbi:MAG: hypothetical protein UMV23_07385, partial [Halanaerobium sp.]|nr:hypothetical protein [Halanaerobium sp.]
MLRLETDRLLLVPLNMENFRLFLEDYRKMEENLCVTFSGNELPPELQVVFRKPYEQALEDVDNFLWYT